MSAIFLSYRRDDSTGYAGRLFDNLVGRFGREQVFMDIETLEPGLDFIEGIDRAIESCGAVVAVIGPNWLSAMNSDGRRRLDDPHDFIRLEISTALRRRVRVIPVLVYNASMPPEDQLPDVLRPLCRLQSFEISDSRWEFDVHRLGDVLAPLIAEPDPDAASKHAPDGKRANAEAKTSQPPAAGKGRNGLVAAIGLLVVGAILGTGWWFSQRPAIEPAGHSLSPSSSSPLPVERPNTGEPSATTSTSRPTSAPAPPPAEEPTTVPASPTAPAAQPATTAPIEQTAGAVAPPPAPLTTVEPGPDAMPVKDTAAQEAEQTLAREIDELLRVAEAHLAELRLTRPAGDNAFEQFMQVLELDPDNPDARNGLHVITERYRGLVEDALARAAFDTAERHLEAARTVDPRSDWLLPMQAEIERQRRDAEAVQPLLAEPRAPTDRDRTYEVCLQDCEMRHQACREEIETDEAGCLSDRSAACDVAYKDCLSDTRELLIWGSTARKSVCAGAHAQCEREAAKDCAGASPRSAAQCGRQLEQCTDECQSTR